jgi:hypothetical protein
MKSKTIWTLAMVCMSYLVNPVYLMAQDETKPFKAEKNMIDLGRMDTKKVDLKVGQKAYIKYKLI